MIGSKLWPLLLIWPLLFVQAVQECPAQEEFLEAAEKVSHQITCLAKSTPNDVCYMTAARLAQGLPKLGYKAIRRLSFSGMSCAPEVEGEEEGDNSFALNLASLLSAKMDLAQSPLYLFCGIFGHAFFFEKGVDAKGPYVRFIQSWGGRFHASVWLNFKERFVPASDEAYAYDGTKLKLARSRFGGGQKLRPGSVKFTDLLQVLRHMHEDPNNYQSGEELFGVGAVQGVELTPNYRAGKISIFEKDSPPLLLPKK